MNPEAKRCKKCILSANFPRIKFDDHGVCNFCNNELLYSTIHDEIEHARIEINRIFNEVRGSAEYDAILCYSGGKDSTLTLKLAVEKYNLKVLSFTLDNGFISPTAFENIERVVNKFGTDHITYRPSYKFMKGLFRVTTLKSIYQPKSLARISANCLTCISIVNMTALKMAHEKNISIILAGFNLGQIPSNTIYFKDKYEFFAETRKPILDKLKSELGPDVSRYLEIPDLTVSKSSNIPYSINLLPLENFTENEIINEILPLGWVKPRDVDGCSTNCLLNTFNNYIHNKKFGYSPYELELSHLIRKNLLSREEALHKLYDQPEEQIAYAYRELDINPSELNW